MKLETLRLFLIASHLLEGQGDFGGMGERLIAGRYSCHDSPGEKIGHGYDMRPILGCAQGKGKRKSRDADERMQEEPGRPVGAMRRRRAS